MAISIEERRVGRPSRLAIKDLLLTMPIHSHPCTPLTAPKRPQVTYSSAHPDAWASLPREFVQSMTTSIYKNLDYLDLCRLAGVSRVFGETATAYKDEVPKAVKQKAVMEAENYFFQHHKKANRRAENGSRSCPQAGGTRSPKQGTPESPSSDAAASPATVLANGPATSPNYACYECCRLIQPDCFARDQPLWIIRHHDGRMSRDDGSALAWGDQRESPRRFCVDCGLSLGFYRSGDQILTQSGRRLWICRCLVVNNKEDSLRSRMCDRCGERCLHSVPRRGYAPVRVRRKARAPGPY